ncbi:hypothetical protein FVE85_8501 [Porphyridium purpureum]|uniref:Uncharacterized protein n=1 Tax=Porphyridium purpureum TaxID=35688 RepID=A0A5J4YHH2_PORPP|nr:hypothetical protein FVE85_8529 [Porphyridium purpureum]KAA8490421.1 hypothetical protein FVE85_1210 [Porphyridium purpureum]KAA8492019.1 hypothetical protein FVE85_8501 [Porphyridium purpureum]|eukprot:POR8979..scf244_11
MSQLSGSALSTRVLEARELTEEYKAQMADKDTAEILESLQVMFTGEIIKNLGPVGQFSFYRWLNRIHPGKTDRKTDRKTEIKCKQAKISFSVSFSVSFSASFSVSFSVTPITFKHYPFINYFLRHYQILEITFRDITRL